MINLPPAEIRGTGVVRDKHGNIKGSKSDYSTLDRFFQLKEKEAKDGDHSHERRA